MFENIRIHKGNISIFRHTKQKFISVEALDLYVENLQLTEESVENQLPVIFDNYNIRGRNFFIRPDNVYALRINSIQTTNGQVSINDFQLVPVLAFDQFKKYYPKKTALFQFTAKKMEFKDLVLKKNKVTLAHANFYDPDFLIYTTNATAVKIKKPSDLELNLEDIRLNNAVVQVMKPDGKKLLYAGHINADVNQLKFNKETREELIPVGYKDFRISGSDILYSNHQDFNIKSLSLSPKKGELKKITVVPNGSAAGKTSMDLAAEHIGFTINTWEFADKKLRLDINEVLVNNIKGTIKASDAKNSKQGNLSGIQFPVTVKKVTVKNSDITYDKDNQPLSLNGLNATVNDIRLTSKKDNSGLEVNINSYLLTTNNFLYRTKFYRMAAGFLKLNEKNIQISNFEMKPMVSRAQFIRAIPVESDLYDIKARQITATGSWDLFSGQKFINAYQMTIQSADANIFRSKIPDDDPKEKPLYSRLLRSIKIPLFINTLNLKDSKLVYEEDTPESAGPGKLTFNTFNMNVKNLNSAKMKGKPTRVDIRISCSFMDLAPLTVNWNFDVADQRDLFNISGRTTGLPARGINPFIRPYLHVSATGTIQEMLFNFRGSPKGLNGDFNLRHKDLKVAILDKQNREKKGFLSAVANLLVKSDSGKLPEDVKVEDVERDATKSFFNLFWKGVEQGLKKTLIGINIGGGTKAPDNGNAAKKEIKTPAVPDQKASDKTEAKAEAQSGKKPFLKSIFRKKENPETK